MTTKGLTYAYVGGLTHKRGEDGFLYVKGLVSDDTLDLDAQRADPTWLNTAVPEWFEVGNIREMHTAKAVGKAQEIQQLGSGWASTVKVVDKETATKVEEGVLTGLSIGIKGARVVKSDSAPNGVITGGTIVEVSLVDRPANPSCSIEIAKAVNTDATEWEFKGVEVTDGNHQGLVATEMPAVSDLEVGEEVDTCRACKGTGKVSDNNSDADCERCHGSGKEPDSVQDDIATSPSTGDAYENLEEGKSATVVQIQEDAESYKAAMSNASINDLPDSDFAYIEPGGKKDEVGKTTPRSLRHFPVHDKAHARNALSRAPQSPFGDKAMPKIKAAARKFGIKVSADNKYVALELAKALVALDVTNKDADFKHDPAMLEAVRDNVISLISQELGEMSDGCDERFDVAQLCCVLETFLSWWQGEAMDDEVPPPFSEGDDTMSYVGLGANPDIIKRASEPDATDEDREAARHEIVKTLGLDTLIATQEAQLKEQAESITVLKAALEEVQEMAAPGGPVLRQTSEQRRTSAAHDAITAKAADFRARAAAYTGPRDVKDALIAEAEKLESAAKSL